MVLPAGDKRRRHSVSALDQTRFGEPDSDLQVRQNAAAEILD
jgi:hypothetical protein